MEIYDPTIKTTTKVYLNWFETIEDGTVLMDKLNNYISDPRKIRRACEQWQHNVNQFIKSKRVKNDNGFSKPIYTNNKLENHTKIVTTSLNEKNIKYLVELENNIEKKISILRTLKDNLVPISKTKIFDYVEGQYFLDSNPINPNKNTLYFVLFDATYKIKPSGGEILYKTLKSYLTENRVTYRIKSKNKQNKTINKNKNFNYDNLDKVKKHVQDNLCGVKGILKLVKVSKHLKNTLIQKEEIFSAVRGKEAYRFNNTQ